MSSPKFCSLPADRSRSREGVFTLNNLGCESVRAGPLGSSFFLTTPSGCYLNAHGGVRAWPRGLTPNLDGILRLLLDSLLFPRLISSKLWSLTYGGSPDTRLNKLLDDLQPRRPPSKQLTSGTPDWASPLNTARRSPFTCLQESGYRMVVATAGTMCIPSFQAVGTPHAFYSQGLTRDAST